MRDTVSDYALPVGAPPPGREQLRREVTLMTLNGTWLSGPTSDQPTLISDIFDMADASFRQGQAVARGDDVAAREAHRRALAALGRILRRADAGEVDASALLIGPPPPLRRVEPGGGINT